MREFASPSTSQSTVYRPTVYRRQTRAGTAQPWDGPFCGWRDSLIDFSALDAENGAQEFGPALAGVSIKASEGAEPAMREGVGALGLQSLQSGCGQDCPVATLPVAFQKLEVSKNLDRLPVQTSHWLLGRTPFAVDGHSPEAHPLALRSGVALPQVAQADANKAVRSGGGDALIR